jgi:GT2 family glycosyltransferase
MSKKLNNRHRHPIEVVQTTVDIVIPVRGRLDLLEQCITAIPLAFDCLVLSPHVNIIIVDNASFEVEKDTSYLSEIDGFSGGNIRSIVVLRQKSNLGFPKACNVGSRRKTSPLIFFLNSDCILEPGSGSILVDRMSRDSKVGVAGMKLLFPDYPTGLQQNENMRPMGRVQHIGLSTRVNGTVHHIFIGWRSDHPKVNAVHEAFAVTGAALMVRRSLFVKVGGFFEDYGAGTYEDVDLCVTIRSLGYNIIVVPEAVGVHHTGATAERYNVAFPLNQNASIFLSRHMNEIIWWDYWLL